MKRLLLVGWDAADWKIIDPLIERGEMPHLSRLISQGARGNIATIYPPLSPMLWTSIATGKRAHKHGVHGFSEPTEDGLSIRPISNLGRKTKAFWNILNQNGKRSVVVGWWPSHPAEPIRGAMVSDHFPPPTGQMPGGPMAPGTVWPPQLAAHLADLRVHGSEISGEILHLFVPEYAKVDQARDKSLHDLASTIAETMSIHAVATELIEHQEWDMAAVYYAGIDHFSHRFMRYHAGKAPRGETADPELFSGIVANAYRYHDVMLGRLLALAGDDCAVMLLSDHGFHSDRLLPDYIPAEAAGPAAEHRHFGMFCLRAPGVRAGTQVYGATVLDITPTVLHLWGLPPGADMDGKVLINAFEDQTVVPPIASWDEVPGEDGRHPPWKQYDGAATVESLQQLINLGYIAPPGDDARTTVTATIVENRYNLARALLDAGMPDKAAEILQELIAQDPEQGRYHLHLFQCGFNQRDLAACARVLDAFDQACDAFAPRAAEELKRRRAECADENLTLDAASKPDPLESLARRKLSEQASGFVLQRVVSRAQLLLADTHSHARQQSVQALLEQLEPASRTSLELAMFLATGYAALKDYPRALEFTRRVRRADRDHWQAMALAARIHQAARRHRECVEAAIDSLSLVYFQPVLHYHMGLSLRHLGEEASAEQSFRVALSQMPGLVDAHLELAKIMRKDDTRLGEAALHTARANVLRKEARRRREAGTSAPARQTSAGSLPVGLHAAGSQTMDRWEGAPPADRSQLVTIVSGLPRSGTSMMMQLLHAAGIAPYTDNRRAADEDNPRGYFEHEQATRLHEDANWLPGARGKAVKIVAQLLPRLPATEQYRIVFLHRNLDEVIASQRAMLHRLGRAVDTLNEGELARIYAGQLVRIQEWLRRAPGIQVLAVSYAQVLADPAATAERLASFLGEPFDRSRAAAAVEPALRRQVRTAVDR
jgi:predicted AlkP superfamily phosphohydrolase/phosphomutase/tetratricopeptide (TPR) repeat protein